MTVPTLSAMYIDQTYIATTIPAFGDTISGSTNPLTCGARICTSTSLNVVWDSIDQLFTVKTLGAADVVGTFIVTLSCSLDLY